MFPAEALLRFVSIQRSLSLNPMREVPHPPVSIDVVVERQFLVLRDSPLGKDPHPYSIPDGPFCNVAIRVTAVVREPPDPTLLGCVDELHVV
jgi:hypothetical protein